MALGAPAACARRADLAHRLKLTPVCPLLASMSETSRVWEPMRSRASDKSIRPSTDTGSSTASRFCPTLARVRSGPSSEGCSTVLAASCGRPAIDCSPTPQSASALDSLPPEVSTSSCGWQSSRRAASSSRAPRSSVARDARPIRMDGRGVLRRSVVEGGPTKWRLPRGGAGPSRCNPGRCELVPLVQGPSLAPPPAFA